MGSWWDLDSRQEEVKKYLPAKFRLCRTSGKVDTWGLNRAIQSALFLSMLYKIRLRLVNTDHTDISPLPLSVRRWLSIRSVTCSRFSLYFKYFRYVIHTTRTIYCTKIVMCLKYSCKRPCYVYIIKKYFHIVLARP